MTSEKKWSHLWVKSSFDESIDEMNNKINVKSRKRSLNDSINNESKSDSINDKSVNNLLNDEKNSLIIDRFVPQNSSHLAFSKFKFKQLNDWFSKQYNDFGLNSESKFLLLNGPTGSGI